MHKYIPLVLGVLASLFLSTCGKDEGNDPQNELIGTWSSSKIEFFGCEGDNLPINCDLICIRLTLEEEGNFEKVDSSEDGNEFTIEGTFTVTDSDLIFCETDGVCLRKPYSLDGNSLTISFTDDEECSTIESYTRS